jgi:hypothetical protein
MRVGFALRHDEDGPAHWLQADGVVARTELLEDGNLVALEFQVMEGHVAAEIQQYIRDRYVLPTRKTGEYAPASVYPPPSAEA